LAEALDADAAPDPGAGDAGRAVADVTAGAGAAALAAADGWVDEDEPDAVPHPAIRTAASTEPIANGDRLLTLALSPPGHEQGRRPRISSPNPRFNSLKIIFFVILFP